MTSADHEESGLSEMQLQISEIVQHGVIDPNFKFKDSEFEILSTLRYDPKFTLANRGATGIADNTISGAQSDLDPQLSMLDLHESLNEPGNSHNNGAPLFQLFQELQKGILPISPPPEPENELRSDKTEQELLKIFYSRFLLLGEHYQRLNLTLDYFHWEFDIPIELLLEKLILAIPCPVESATDLRSRMQSLYYLDKRYKMRILVSHIGKMRIEAHELPPNPVFFPTTSQYFVNTVLGGFLSQPSEIWDVFIDTQPMTASPFTTFKTTRRDHYNAARVRMTELRGTVNDPAAKSEILVYNSSFELMEGSITNVAVLRQGTAQSSSFYQTPYLSTGCLCGVTRYYLLKKNLINEGNTDVRDLNIGDEILLFNGVMGCVRAVIRNSMN
ncbi:LANO_0C08504g1_1 [Lachancea nothofagi CBS 11611]|uniref:LANO_0C08504g1_1 n=1 Tax=Lachancea nothofagi CBS 11611 TaxID=1266666 RepID=A0A1G4JA10_9SACH|nr:LANO_0C08504g1_1 [Lachancea nothofagi CBS 11611]